MHPKGNLAGSSTIAIPVSRPVIRRREDHVGEQRHVELEQEPVLLLAHRQARLKAHGGPPLRTLGQN